MLQLQFTPGDAHIFELTLAGYGYEKCWNKHGQSIVSKFNELTGLGFQQNKISVVIVPGEINNSGMTGKPMEVGAGYYSEEEKIAVLSHELAHRLLGNNKIWVDTDSTAAKYVEHRRIYLFLYDAWCDLYGEKFAQAAVQRELQDAEYYEKAWKWVLKKNREQRSKSFNTLRKAKIKMQK